MEPKLLRFADRLSADLVGRWLEGGQFVFEDVTPDDLAQQADVAGKLVEKGIWTINEARERFGWGDAVAWGDTPWFPNIMAPPGAAPSQLALPAPPAEEPPAEEKPTEVVEGASAKRAPSPLGKALSERDHARLQRGYQAAAKRYFQELEREVVEAVRASEDLAALAAREGKGAKALDDDTLRITSTLVSWPEKDEALEGRMRRPTERTVERAGMAALAELDIAISFDLTDERVVAWMESYLPRLAGDVNLTTRQDIAITLASGIQQGDTQAALADRVRDVFSAAKDARAEAIARSEEARAQVRGHLEGWRQSGVVKAKVWRTAGDPCEDCAPMDGVQIGLEETFYDKGDETARGTVLDYEDVEGPPLHTNCNCYVEAVLEEI
jgi:hypothetical protein